MQFNLHFYGLMMTHSRPAEHMERNRGEAERAEEYAVLIFGCWIMYLCCTW